MNNNELIEKIETAKLKRADSASYLKFLCNKTLEKTKDIDLPVISPEVTEKLQKHLVAYETLEGKDSFTTLINIFHALKIIQKKEKNPTIIETLKPVYEWLNHFEQIIVEIQDPKMQSLLEIAKRRLHQQISLFNGLYHHIVDQSSSPLVEYSDLLQSAKEDEIKK